jgi:hypothetical protein
MLIGKKANVMNPGLAWIPGFGPVIIAYEAAKMEARPWWIMLIGCILTFAGFIFLVSRASITFGIALLILGGAALIYFSVYAYIWYWKLFIAIGRPGLWALIPLFSLPFMPFAFIPSAASVDTLASLLVTALYLIMVGIAAWGEGDMPKKKPSRR